MKMEGDNATEQDMSYGGVSKNAFDDDEEEDAEEEGWDFVDEELEQKDRDMTLDATGGEADADSDHHRSFFGEYRKWMGKTIKN